MANRPSERRLSVFDVCLLGLCALAGAAALIIAAINGDAQTANIGAGLIIAPIAISVVRRARFIDRLL